MAGVNSLQNICEVKIAVMIANHKDIKKKIFTTNFFDLSEDVFIIFKEWRMDLNCIINRILKKFPSDVENRISKFLVIYVVIHMWKWAKYQHLHFRLPLKFIKNFIKVSFFTSKGCVNEELAARELLKKSRMGLFMKYKIACHYYLEDIIPVLWQQVRHQENFKSKLKEENIADPVVMWSEYLEEKEKVNPPSLLIYATESFLAEAFQVSLDKENVAGIKYCWRAMTPSKRILDSCEYFKALRREGKYVSVHDAGWLIKLSFYSNTSYYDQLSLSKGFEKVINILEFFILELKQGECKDFLFSFNVWHELLYYLLRWPYQHLFLPVADYCFEVVRDELKFSILSFKEEEYYSILHNIVDLGQNPDFCRTYNYPYLLREFWSRSPQRLKEFVISIECERIERPYTKPSGIPCYRIISNFLLEKLILHSDVTFDDESNFRLILENTNSQDKTDIFKTKGKNVCQKLISHEKFKLASVFLESLDLDEEKLITFKKGFISSVFRRVLENENIALAEQYVEWVVKPDAIDDLKKEIFSEAFEFPKIMDLILHCRVSVDFLNRIYKWFFLTDEKLEHWKTNVIFDKDFAKYFVNMSEACSLMFDIFFKFLGYSVGKTQDMKREILLKAMPHIILQLVERYVSDNKDCETSLESKIIYLCLYNKVRVNEFANFIHTWCQDYVELKMCLFCRNSNHVYLKESELYCSVHEMKIILPEDINKICSSITDKLTKLMEVRERAKKSLKNSHLEEKICSDLCNLELVNHCKNCEK
ncbi:UNVERIFIED_CONTAM: hypothetical protein RMT77_017109 [Armadillidium vulgare]